MTDTRGDLAIVLHTHMPYVESFGTWPFGEEWLWRCVAESYLRVAPLIEGRPVTLGVTPVLADQFEAMRGDAGDRMLAFFNDSREYCFGEDMRSFHEVGEGELSIALEPQLADYRSAAARFEGELARDLNGLLRRLGESGVELLGGPATHAVLPLLATDFGADLQLVTGRDSHARRFGDGAGIWLPECAYKPGVDAALARNAVKYFCVDRSAALGNDSLDNLEPVTTPAGPVALPIDWQTIERVWHEDGYPAAAAYRSSFKRSIHSLMAWKNGGGAWNADAARAQAHAHAAAFVRDVATRLEVYADERGRRGLCVFAVDTELLGHWWYEGPWWLEEVLAHAAAAGIELVTLGQALERRDAAPPAQPATSSWGEAKDLSTWDGPAAAAYAWQSRAAELELFDLLGHDAAAAEQPAALRAARELLALQSSDWAFIATRETAGGYASDRYAGHLAAFERALSSLQPPAGPAMRQSAPPASGNGHQTAVAGLAPDLTAEALAAIRFPPSTDR